MENDEVLLEYRDGTAVETVLMRQPYGNSICVSTQAGCSMGCIFVHQPFMAGPGIFPKAKYWRRQ